MAFPNVAISCEELMQNGPEADKRRKFRQCKSRLDCTERAV